MACSRFREHDLFREHTQAKGTHHPRAGCQSNHRSRRRSGRETVLLHVYRSPGRGSVANKPGEFIRWGLISGVEKIEFPYGMAKKQELPNEEEGGLRLDEFTALLLHFVVSR